MKQEAYEKILERLLVGVRNPDTIDKQAGKTLGLIKAAVTLHVAVSDKRAHISARTLQEAKSLLRKAGHYSPEVADRYEQRQALNRARYHRAPCGLSVRDLIRNFLTNGTTIEQQAQAAHENPVRVKAMVTAEYFGTDCDTVTEKLAGYCQTVLTHTTGSLKDAPTDSFAVHCLKGYLAQSPRSRKRWVMDNVLGKYVRQDLAAAPWGLTMTYAQAQLVAAHLCRCVSNAIALGDAMK